MRRRQLNQQLTDTGDHIVERQRPAVRQTTSNQLGQFTQPAITAASQLSGEDRRIRHVHPQQRVQQRRDPDVAFRHGDEFTDSRNRRTVMLKVRSQGFQQHLNQQFSRCSGIRSSRDVLLELSRRRRSVSRK